MSPPPRVHTRMKIAAKMRVRSSSWTAIAVELNCNERTCRRWPELYPEEWKRLYCEAEDEVLCSVGSDSITLLHHQTRSKDEWVRQGACKFLAKMREHARDRLEKKTASPVAADFHDSIWAPIAVFLDTQDDDSIQHFLEHYLAKRLANRGAASVSGLDGAGTPLPE